MKPDKYALTQKSEIHFNVAYRMTIIILGISLPNWLRARHLII